MQPQTPAARVRAGVPGHRPVPGPAPIDDRATEHRTDGPRLHVAAAARRVGVAPSTLRTWDRRYGIGPTDHAPGRHRRYSPDDLARLELMRRALLHGRHPRRRRHPRPHRPAAPPRRRTTATGTTAHPDTAPAPRRPGSAGPGQQQPAGTAAPTTPGPHRRDGTAPARRRVAGPRPGAGRARARRRHRPRPARRVDRRRSGVQATWDDVVRPVLAAVAQRWADTGAGIEIEHLLSDCVTGVFSAVAASTPNPPRTARPGTARRDGRRPAPTAPRRARRDPRAARRVLPVAGHRPACDALVAAIRRTAPVAVLLWSQLSSTADPQVLRSLPRTRPGYRSFVAGPGWAEVELPPQVGRLESLEEATDALSAAATV